MYGGQQGGGGWPGHPSGHLAGLFNNIPGPFGPASQQHQQQLQQQHQSRLPTTSNPNMMGHGGPSVGLMLPPSSVSRPSGGRLPGSSTAYGSGGSMNNHNIKCRSTLLQEEKKRAAQARQQEQAEREQAKKAAQDLFATPGLFSEPQRVSDEGSGQVAQVLGTFYDVQGLISSKTSIIGIDYQPPTPAPSLHHHIIGDEDDDKPPLTSQHSSSAAAANQRLADQRQQHQQHMLHNQQMLNRRPTPAMPRPMSGQRLPENINQMHRPMDARSVSGHMSSANNNRLQPSSNGGVPSRHLSPSTGMLHQQQQHLKPSPQSDHSSSSSSSSLSYMQQQPQQHNNSHQTNNSSTYLAPNVASENRFKPTGRDLPKLSLPSDNQLEAMLNEMKAMPAPLSAIMTPKVDLSSHAGNMNRFGAPKYFTEMPPLLNPIMSPPRQKKMEPANEINKMNRLSPFPSSMSIPAPLKPLLSEESDSDDDKSPMVKSMPPPTQALSRAASTAKAPTPTLAAAAANSNPSGSSNSNHNQPKLSSNQSSSADTSSDDSSSEDSSSEDEDSHKKNAGGTADRAASLNEKSHLLDRVHIGSGSHDDDDDEANLEDNNVFSLENLITRVRSTHSPGGPSGMSQHAPSPRTSQSFTSTLDSLGLPPGSPSDALLSRDDDAPINGFLSHTPQPLPDLMDDIVPLSPMPQSPSVPSPVNRLINSATAKTTPSNFVNKRSATAAAAKKSSSRNISLSSDDEDVVDHGRRVSPAKKVTPTRKRASPNNKSPTKRQQNRKASIRLSTDDSDSDNDKQKRTNHLTPNRPNTTPSGRPLPRASATPLAKSQRSSDDSDDGVIDAGLLDQRGGGRKRRAPKGGETLSRSKKAAAAGKAAAASSRQQQQTAPVSNAFISSSTSSSEDEGHGKNHRKTLNSASSSSSRRTTNGMINSAASDLDSAGTLGSSKSGGKTSAATSRKLKVEDEDEEETGGKGSEKERSNKKTAISMIFASSKAGKHTGKSGIKVEVHHQAPTSGGATHHPAVMMSPPTVAIKSQGLSSAATVIPHASPVPLSEIPKRPPQQETSLSQPRRRPDGRPIVLCRIPFSRLNPSIVSLISRSPQKENTPVVPDSLSQGRERRQSGCSSVSTASSRLSSSYNKRRRRKEDTNSDAGHQQQQQQQQQPPPNKKSKMSYGSPLRAVTSSTASQPTTTPSTTTASDSSSLMPPPNRVFYSYMEHRRPEDEEFADGDFASYMTIAKKLKHEADAETVRERQAIKYLQAVLYFSLCGNYTEIKGDKQAAFNMYKETLDLVRHVSRNPSNGSTVDNKLAVLSHRCQSLLYLRLYKLRRQELVECQKILGDHLLKAQRTEHQSPNGGQPTISPTPSPAGSEGSVCSKSSGYTSASELMGGNGAAAAGAANAPPSLTVPQNIMQKQHQYFSYLSQCHELWEMADLCAHRGHCEDFIIRLDRMFGPLTLHSSVKDLVRYTQVGLDMLSKEKEIDRS